MHIENDKTDLTSKKWDTYVGVSPFETIGVSDRQNDPVDVLDEVPISIVDDQFLDGPQAGGERHPLTSMEKAVDVDDGFGSALRINKENRENFQVED